MKHRIVVLGAGYAGATTAGRLARRLHPDDAEITVINQDADFVERIRMHQLATGQPLKHRPLDGVFAGTSVTVRAARVTAVDVDHKIISVWDDHGEDKINYDTLVYALGSTAADNGVPGVVEHAHYVAGRQSASQLRRRLDDLDPGSAVLVVGGGLTAIEVGTEIADNRPDLRVTIAARHGVGEWLSDRGQRHLRTVFERLKITIREQAGIVRIDETGAVTAEDERIPADLTIWAAGFATHPIAAATNLAVADNGQIVVDKSMRSISHPDVYAVGDAGLAEGAHGKPLRMSCASGIPMGWVAADAIVARLTGRTARPFTIPYVLQCISLGRHDGLVQFVTPDDQARSSVITGTPAARIKEFICAGAGWSIAHPTVLLPTRRRHITVPSERTAVTDAA
ncbi:MAG TPA: FAD-dependent oxidoreductase [Microlunatus sp.]